MNQTKFSGVKVIENSEKFLGKSQSRIINSSKMLSDINPILETIDLNNILRSSSKLSALKGSCLD